MMRARGRDLQRALGVRLTMDIGQVDVSGWIGGWRRGDRRRFQRVARLPVGFELSKMVDAHHRRCRGDFRLGHIGAWHVEAPHPEAVEVSDDRQRAADRAQRPVQGELAQPGGIARQATLLAGVDDGRGHRQVEATPLFGKLRRREVDRYFAAGKLEATVVDRDLHAFAGFLKRAVAEPDDVEPGEAVGDIRLYLNPDTIEAEHRPGEGPGEHQRRYYTSLSICAS